MGYAPSPVKTMGYATVPPVTLTGMALGAAAGWIAGGVAGAP